MQARSQQKLCWADWISIAAASAGVQQLASPTAAARALTLMSFLSTPGTSAFTWKALASSVRSTCMEQPLRRTLPERPLAGMRRGRSRRSAGSSRTPESVRAAACA